MRNCFAVNVKKHHNTNICESSINIYSVTEEFLYDHIEFNESILVSELSLIFESYFKSVKKPVRFKYAIDRYNKLLKDYDKLKNLSPNDTIDVW